MSVSSRLSGDSSASLVGGRCEHAMIVRLLNEAARAGSVVQCRVTARKLPLCDVDSFSLCAYCVLCRKSHQVHRSDTAPFILYEP